MAGPVDSYPIVGDTLSSSLVGNRYSRGIVGGFKSANIRRSAVLVVE